MSTKEKPINILVTLPTYCERLNIVNFLNLLMEIPNLDAVVMDDDSPDRTWELVEGYPEYQKRVYLIRRMSQRGRGLAGIEGFKYALARKDRYDCVVEMDADFSHRPDEVMKLVENLKDSDLVLGSRFVKGYRDMDRNLKRRALSFLSNLYVRMVTGMPFCDPNSGFKAYRMSALERMDIHKLTAANYSITQEILYRAFRKGLRIKEIPITFYDRKEGESKVNLYIIIDTLFCILRIRLRALSKDW